MKDILFKKVPFKILKILWSSTFVSKIDLTNFVTRLGTYLTLTDR